MISSDPANAVNVIATRPGGIQFNLFFQGSPIFANYLFSRRSVPFSEQDCSRLPLRRRHGVLWPLIRPVRSPVFSRQSPIRSCCPLPSMYKPRTRRDTDDHMVPLPDLSGLTSTVFAACYRCDKRCADLSDQLAVDATSFTLPDGVLLASHSYFYRVILGI